MEINFLNDDSSKFNKNDENKDSNSKDSARFLKPKSDKEVAEAVPDAYKASSEDMFDEKKSGSKIWLILIILVVLAGGYFAIDMFLLNPAETITITKTVEDPVVTDSAIIDSVITTIVDTTYLTDSLSSDLIKTDSIIPQNEIPDEILKASSSRVIVSQIIVSLFSDLLINVEIEHINLQNKDLLIELSAAKRSDLLSYVQIIKNMDLVKSIAVISEETRNGKFVSLLSISSTQDLDQNYQDLLSSDQLKAALTNVIKSTEVIEFEETNFSNISTFIIRANASKKVVIDFFRQSLIKLDNSKFLKLSVVATPDNKFQLNLMVQLIE